MQARARAIHLDGLFYSSVPSQLEFNSSEPETHALTLARADKTRIAPNQPITLSQKYSLSTHSEETHPSLHGTTQPGIKLTLQGTSIHMHIHIYTPKKPDPNHNTNHPPLSIPIPSHSTPLHSTSLARKVRKSHARDEFPLPGLVRKQQGTNARTHARRQDSGAWGARSAFFPMQFCHADCIRFPCVPST